MNQESLAKRQRLKDDFEFYSRNCLHIRTKDAGIVPFRLNEAQIYIHKRLEQQIKETGKARAIILKGRQQGASTLIQGRYVHKTTHNKGVRAFILTHDGESTNALFEMTKRYYDLLPDFVKPSIEKSNAKELKFDQLDSGYKIGTAGNKSIGRGQTIQFFHGSEVAFWQNAGELTKGVLQAVPDADNTEIILEKGESEFQAIFVPWFWQSEYKKKCPPDFKLTDYEEELVASYKLTNEQLFWRRRKISELSADGVDGKKAFKQEYPMNAAEAFQITSGMDTLINADHCMKARMAEFNGNGPHVVGVDPSRGGDRFAIMHRQGRKMWGMKAYQGTECDKLGKNVAICKAILDTVDSVSGKKPDRMFIDFGSGADIVDRLHELGYEDRVKSIHFGSTPLDPIKYKNKRNEIWGLFAEWLTDESMPVDIPDSDELQADICASPYTRDSNDRRVLLPKDKIKAEFGFSPDFGDAAGLTFSEPVAENKQWEELNYSPRSIV